MPDDDREFTSLGRERMLKQHEDRLDALDSERLPKVEGRLKKIEDKEETRDKRWDSMLKAFITIAVGIIIAVVSALIGAGVHP